MLQGITDVLTTIGDFFSSIIDFVGGLLGSLVEFATKLAAIPSQISAVLGGLPVYFVGGIVMLIGIMIVLRVVGRD